MFDDYIISAIAAEIFPPNGPTVNPWPFPTHPPTPWTPKQIKEYEQQQRSQLPESPL